jgi:putative membrane-bound dehydrogenase-like protein
MTTTILALLLLQVSPEEERATFRIDPALRVELVAAEPEVQSPVSMAFDEDGALWVVEMLDYPNPEPAKGPQGRVKRLVDRDGDGRYETATVFAEGLMMANGVLPWKGGVLVTRAPTITWYRDADGDGKAEIAEPFFEGFAVQNPQLRVSHPTFGLDNGIYVANGQRGGKIKAAGRAGAAPIDINGMDFRFDPVHDVAEPVSGFGQFGLSFDDWGRRFVCTNRNHLIPLGIPNRYYARNPFLAAPRPLGDNQGAGGSAKVFPLSAAKTLAAHHAGSFTASCGVTVYRGSLLPETWKGRVFTCEPTGNLVHEEVLTPDGASFTWKPPKEGAEFLASTDSRFRPVSLAHGPDGALYVVDMYREEVEHPDWVPADHRYRYRFDHRRDQGRIWRIVPASGRGTPAAPSLSRSSTASLVKLLDHADAWWRTTAQRLLHQRQDGGAWGPLRELLVSGGPLGRVHALWTLEGHRRLDVDAVLRGLVDPHPRVREHSAALAERWASTWPVTERLQALADDADARVRWQAALTLGAWEGDGPLGALARIADAGAEDRWTRLAVATAAATRSAKLLARVKDLRMVRELAAIAGARGDAEEAGLLAKHLEGADAARQAAALNGLAEGAGRRSRAVDGRFGTLMAAAAARALEAERPLEERLDAARLLPQVPAAAALPALEKLLASEVVELRMAAIGSAAARREPEIAGLLLAPWKGYLPSARREVLEALGRSPERIDYLLKAVEEGRFLAADVGPVLARRLVGHDHAALRERAKKALAEALPPDRSQVLAAYKPVLGMEGDLVRGREVFAKNCAACHRVAGVGTAVGPDISDTLSKSKEQLLNDILDPSRVIDNNYVNYLVRTKSGDVKSGFIAAQTASSLTLRRGEGQEDVVLREDIADLRSSGLSLMPEGLEKQIPAESMADLLRFLKAWRDLPPLQK